jgi:two-component system, chemotaxis family, chemotaxis protein CheY
MMLSRRILLVDDDESIREFISQALAEEGYEVMIAAQGAAALALVDEGQPNLILLDLRMPVLDGWGFLEAYRGKPGPHAPVVALTASHDKAASKLPPGVNAFIAKPFDLYELLDLVDKLTDLPQ